MRQLPENDMLVSDKTELTKIGELVYEGYYSLSDLGIPSRVFSNWKKEGVVPWFPADKTAKFDTVQATSILMMDELRLGGISIAGLKQISNELFIKPFEENFAEKFLLNEIKLRGHEDEVSKELIEMMKYDGYNYLQRIEINPFSISIRRFIRFREESALKIIFQKPSSNNSQESDKKEKYHHKPDLIYNVKYFLHSDENSNEIIDEPHIHLPLKKYIRQLYNLDKEKFVNNSMILSDQEKTILKEIRSGRIDEIVITFQEGKINKATTMKSSIVTEEELENFFFSNTWRIINRVEIKKRYKGKAYVETYKVL